MRLVADDNIPFLHGVPESLGFDTVYLPGEGISAADVRNADALLVRTRTCCGEMLLRGSDVRIVVSATAGYDHLDTAYLERAGIKWANCPGCNAAAVGQYVRSSLLALAREGFIRLGGCRVGIVGVGRVGTEVEKACRQLGCGVMRNDPPRAAAGVGGFVELDALCRECDVITFHVPLVQGGRFPTFHLAGEDFFNSLRRRPAIINAARGGVVDERAWLRSLEKGITSAAVADTWEGEPEINAALLGRAFIATPHIAGYSAEGKANATRQAVAILCDFFGIAPEFEIALPPPPASVKPEGGAGGGAPMTCSLLADTARLKASPGSFEALRENCPLRRETWNGTT